LVRVSNGRVIPDADDNLLYKCMLEMLQDKDALISMGEMSRKIVTQEFSIQKEAEGFIKAIDTVVGHWRPTEGDH